MTPFEIIAEQISNIEKWTRETPKKIIIPPKIYDEYEARIKNGHLLTNDDYAIARALLNGVLLSKGEE